ncbi:MAG: hypothetical protein ACLUEQ_13665 [Cloacibacillus evryensis]
MIESYANPFRTYPLAMDYIRFRTLFEDAWTAISSTRALWRTRRSKRTRRFTLEAIVENKADWKSFGGIPGIEYMAIPGFSPTSTTGCTSSSSPTG